MNFKLTLLCVCWCFGSVLHVRGAADQASLAGTWKLRLDKQNQGVREQWFSKRLNDTVDVTLPGSLPAQGIGDDISTATPWIGGVQNPAWTNDPAYKPYADPKDFHFPFWLQPSKYYAGPAWYQREINIPEAWTNRRVSITLERPHWETRVWVDGVLLGTNRSLSTPHVYELGPDIKPGKHLLTLRVDNSLVVDIGVNSHAVTDHTQGNWNGVVGHIQLEATPLVWLREVQIFTDQDNERIALRGLIGNKLGTEGKTNLLVRIEEITAGSEPRLVTEELAEIAWGNEGGRFDLTVRTPAPKLWDEFHPNRYRAVLKIGGQEQATHSSFAFRKIGTEQTQFTINGHKTFFRGTLECCIFPLTGHPPVDVESWRRIIRIAKAHGLNMIRFHSYCPPEAAFEAADELGFYYQVETCWPNQSTTIGEGKPVDQWVYEETDYIVSRYGNHPSFLLMAHGNEPGGDKANAFLAKYVEHYKALDTRRLWTSGSGWPQLPQNQFHVTPDPRIQAWGDGLKSRINVRPPETLTDYRDYIQQKTVPVISHEIGEWCVYPNLDEIPKYTGYLKPRNFEIFRKNLEKKGMMDQSKQFLMASGKLQTMCYKEEIESALRTPGMGGFQLLDLHDFPGQGTALVGVLDPFWDSKGYVAPEEFRRFCNSTVPLARLQKRVFTTDESFEADLEAAHFGEEPLHDAVIAWAVEDTSGKVFQAGRQQMPSVPLGSGIPLGTASVALKNLPAPAAYKLRYALTGTMAGLERGYTNDWDFWVYPAQSGPASSEHVLITSELDEPALRTLKSGRKVLLSIPPRQVATGPGAKVVLGFSSIFWNTAWTQNQPPHTLGILCDPKHPLLALFPTEYHSNWQWWYVISRSAAMNLDELPKSFRPVIQVIDDWVTNRKLGLAFEARVAGGKLLVASIDLKSEMSDNPVLRQLRASMLHYMDSDAFNPSTELSTEDILALYTKSGVIQSLGGKIIRASSAHPGYEPEKAIDGDPATLWHSDYQQAAAGFPHEIAIALDRASIIKGLRVLQRQGDNHNGWVKEYEVYAGESWQKWGEPVAKGSLGATENEQTITFERSASARFLRFVIKSGYGSGPWGALAELDIVPGK